MFRGKFSQTSFIAIPLVLVIYSCNQGAVKIPEPLQKNFAKPDTIFLDTMPAPKRVQLGKMPPPSRVRIPDHFKVIAETNTKANDVTFNFPLPQNKNDVIPQGHFTNYDTEDGLALSVIRCSFMDSRGRLWFGSGGGGVSCYDGSGFTNYSEVHGLASSMVLSIAEDKKGNIWFASYTGGVSRFDGKQFTVYSVADGLADNLVFNISLDSTGNLWFATLNGASRFDGNRFTSFDTTNGLPHNNINNIVSDQQGNQWFVGFGGGLTRYDGKSFHTYNMDDGLPTNYLICMFQDSKGIIWLGSNEKGIIRFDGKNFRTIKTGNNPASNTITAINEDKAGNLWFATYGNEVYRYDGERFIRFSTEQGLANNNVASITNDLYGNVWFGTYGGGVSCYRGDALSFYTGETRLPGKYIRCITEDKKGNLWMGTDGSGAVFFDGRNVRQYTREQGLGNEGIGGVIEDRLGRIWFATLEGGISCLDGNTFTNYTKEQGLNDNGAHSIFEDSRGNIWFGIHNKGVTCFDGREFITYTTEQGLAFNTVISFIEDRQGKIWFATGGGGVSCFDGKRFVNFSEAQGLSNNYVVDIEQDNAGNFWFATITGISRFDGSGIFSLHTGDGLPSEMVYNVIQDSQGMIWMGTNEGITRLSFREFSRNGNMRETGPAGLLSIDNKKLASLESVWDTYNVKTGYPIKDMVDAAILIKKRNFPNSATTDTGKIWASCGDMKLINFDPALVSKNNKAPEVFIRKVSISEHTMNWHGLWEGRNDSILINQQEMMVYGRTLSANARDSIYKKFGDIRFEDVSAFYPVPQKLVLPYTHNQISFEFGAVETNRNFLLRYQYYLEGYDKEWSDITEKTTAAYGNIAGGNYIFRVRARSAEGAWSGNLEYKFRVLPPWWRTWWAYAVYTAIGFVMIWLIIRWRTNTLRKEKIRLGKKVEERTIQLKEEKEKVELTLTDLRKTQVQLIQSAKMASLGELTAGIAHEIQNPLNFVNNFSDVNTELIDELKVELETGNQQEVMAIIADLRQNEEKINHHGKRAGAIVKGMLQHSRSGGGEMEPTDINVLADEYLRLAWHGVSAKDKSLDVKINTGFDDNIGLVKLIPQDIGRVLLNVFNNAFYTVAEKKKHHPDYYPEIKVETRRREKTVIISVKDNGNGIPQKIMDKVFQPFFTTKPTGEGTGLGLSLAYDIVQSHGGNIRLSSVEGEGSEFIVELDIKQ